ncbi:MAG: GNAT family N-acetyltransferase [Propionibacteriaceae bacterium]|nr:GNAT family N-acetyltransferase [Propionibacteriaceae bacterium]
MPPSTDRLILAEMTLNDLPALQAMMQDPEVMTAYEGPYSDSEVLAWLTRQIDRYHDDGFGLWKVILRESGALIGQCGITWQDIDGHRVLEIGYLFNRAHWHQGYATEAARACRTWAFTELGASEVFSQIRDTNIASMNVAIRMGMTIRSRFVKHFRGIDMPHFAFAIDRATWEMLTDPLFIVRLREKDDSGTTNVDDIDWDAL